MRIHLRPGPALGAGGLFGVVAVIVGQCTPPSSDADSAPTTAPVVIEEAIPAIVPATLPPSPAPSPPSTWSTTIVVSTVPSTVLATLPPITTPPTTAPPAAPPVAPPTAAPPAPPAAPPPAPAPTAAPTTVAAAPPAAPPPPAPAPTEPPPPPAPAPAPAPPAPPAPSGSPSSDAVALANQQRVEAGLPLLAESGALADAARAHSIDQASMQTMTHTGSDGSNAGDRIARAGYSASTWGENVAAGYGSASGVIDGWMGSAGHRNNILDPAFTVIGVASAQASDGTLYWTMVLAA